MSDAPPPPSPVASSGPSLPEQPGARAQRTGLRNAVAALRTLPAEPYEPNALVAALEQLRAALARHVEFSESANGLFAEIRAEAPHLLNRVEHLEAEHDELAASIDHALAVASGGQPAAAGVAVADVVKDFEGHLHRGVVLVYDAYNVDISSAD